MSNTPQRIKLIDVFMAFLVVVGGVQFVYCVLAGNYVCLRDFLHHISTDTALGRFLGAWAWEVRSRFSGAWRKIKQPIFFARVILAILLLLLVLRC